MGQPPFVRAVGVDDVQVVVPVPVPRRTRYGSTSGDHAGETSSPRSCVSATTSDPSRPSRTRRASLRLRRRTRCASRPAGPHRSGAPFADPMGLRAVRPHRVDAAVTRIERRGSLVPSGDQSGANTSISVTVVSSAPSASHHDETPLPRTSREEGEPRPVGRPRTERMAGDRVRQERAPSRRVASATGGCHLRRIGVEQDPSSRRGRRRPGR